MTKTPILAALKRFLAEAIDSARELVFTNTFKTSVLFGLAAFLSNLDAAWLNEHPTIKTWLPPALAAFTAISYKVGQIRAAKRKT
jgi:hypothetical protein